MRRAAAPLLPSPRVRRLVALVIMVCAPGCDRLLGISDPMPDDRRDGAVDDGPTIDSSPPCVTPAVFDAEQRFAIGGIGTALAVGQLDRMVGRDVAVAVGDGVQILSGDGTGAFSLGMKVPAPMSTEVDGLVIDDFDADADDDLVVWDDGGSAIAAIRQDSSMVPSTFLAPQPLPGPFGGLTGVLVGQLDGQMVPDLLVKDALAARAFTSKLLNPISFTREPNAIAGVDALDRLVAVGQLDGQGGHDAAFVGAGGEVRIASGAPNFTAAALVATGARDRLVGFGKLDEDADVDLIVGTSAGGVIYRGGGGTFTQVAGTLAAVSGPDMQVIDVNGDGKDDLVLAGRIVYQCAPATPGGPGVFTQFEPIDASGPALMVDVTGDGKPDLIRVDGTELKVRVQR
jgi:hypothetical protein